MPQNQKVYRVNTGHVDISGDDSTNFSATTVLANNASEAITKAKKKFVKGEYPASVELIATLD